ncbi:aldose epimerase family protein [Membranihabitans marinus]|uniref:aldose epimerase family protein n=1 Tax=Membranihabitans marinus TaxID=1227546 RepID=UPI001F1A9D91|nr:aldose epimerase family protein [Membranihabitans marinus]
MKIGLLLILFIALGLGSCISSSSNENTEYYSIAIDTTALWVDDEAIVEYSLENKSGMKVVILNYGGIISQIWTKDKLGELQDVVLGFNDYSSYLKSHPFFGALVGRYGNRIAKGIFSIEDSTYTLFTNNGVNHLHGGKRGFDKVIWDVKPLYEDNALELSYVSVDGEEGYPGNLSVTIIYRLTDENELEIEYQATTDKPTIVNLTQHSYFNLGVDTDILQHQIMINADEYLPVDETLIPTGELASVQESPFDFRAFKEIGQDIDEMDDIQIARGGGYDHCYVLNKDKELSLAAEVREPESGRVMKVWTTEPGVQFYTGNFLNGSLEAKWGGNYGKRAGFCLETQHFPNSPNQPNFPQVTLLPNDRYYTKTVYSFSVKGD